MQIAYTAASIWRSGGPRTARPPKIKAFLDMIGDKDLDVDRDVKVPRPEGRSL